MNWSLRARVVSVVAALLFCPVADCQNRQSERTSPAQANTCLTESLIASSSCRVIRAIEDPATRQHWLLVRDLGRPAEPALLVQIRTGSAASIDQRSKPQRSALPVIRPGDRLVVSEKTVVSEGRFDATALNAAAVGEALTVRLKLSGNLLHARATAPGQATLVTVRSEARE